MQIKEFYYNPQTLEEKFQPQSGNIKVIIQNRSQEDLKPMVATNSVSNKTKIISNFKFYWRAPRNINPKPWRNYQQNHIGCYSIQVITTNNHIKTRTSTNSTNLIMTSTRAASPTLCELRVMLPQN